MNTGEAKRILLACRPDTVDRQDPDVQAALALVERDAALAEWWRDQQQVGQVLRERFRSLPVPSGLKAEILAANKIIEVRWWRTTRVRAAAIAAVLVTLLSVIVWYPSGATETFEQFRDRMVRMVIREYRMDITTADESAIRNYLDQSPSYPDFKLPDQLKDVPLFGAGRLTWTGKPVSMICFERKPNVLMYLFMIDRSAFASPPGKAPEFQEVANRATVSWSEGDRVYTLSSDAGAEDLKSLMK